MNYAKCWTVPTDLLELNFIYWTYILRNFHDAQKSQFQLC